MNRLTGLLVLAVLVTALGWGTGGLWARNDRDVFDHDSHEGLFPSCTPCHEGVAEQDNARIYTVTADDCARCHDDDEMGAVDWRPPVAATRFATFDHALHVGDFEAACADCHQQGKHRMAIGPSGPEACFECHDGEHLGADAECRTCHVPLTQIPELPQAAVANFPRPATHEDDTFLREHGKDADMARCATCHAQESCLRCHLNGEGTALIQDLRSDSRVAELNAGKEGTWPLPVSHTESVWAREHGLSARVDASSCATCHGRETCERCHGEGIPEVLAALVPPRPSRASGVPMGTGRPPGHPPGFATEHAVAAAVNSPRCENCHSENECASCHRGASSPGFHPVNFLSRHAAEVFAADLDCQSCHSAETFCRSCHESAGMGQQARSGTNGYHDAQPLWLLNHGRAARQGMESCASCHQQKDCLRCHSAKTGWGVNPHGPDFDADRMGDRSLVSCASCHYSDPR